MQKIGLRLAKITIFSFCGLMLVGAPVEAATIDWAGRTWTVKSGSGMGPGPNDWSNSSRSVFVDARNRLHLKVRKINGVWNSAEVWLPSSLGYGRYDWTVDSRVDQEDPNLIAAMFMYQDDTHELDIEHSRWKDRYTPINSSFNIQPAGGANSDTFNLRLANGPSRQTIFWSATSVTMTINQNGVNKRQWIYTGPNNFVPGSEVVHLNHWMFQGTPPNDKKHEKDFILSNFTYSP